ncbi:hypothetical protein Tco_0150213, partial [Tanacetum coccineum]
SGRPESKIVRPTFEDAVRFELKGEILKELRENTFSETDNEDANEHIDKVLEILDLFHKPDVNEDQLYLMEASLLGVV